MFLYARPEESPSETPFGRSGGVVEAGTDHARAGSCMFVFVNIVSG